MRNLIQVCLNWRNKRKKRDKEIEKLTQELHQINNEKISFDEKRLRIIENVEKVQKLFGEN